MDGTVFAAILAAALLHAAWNSVVKVGLDRFRAIMQMALIHSGIAVLVLPFVALPAEASWPWIAASGLLHTGYKVLLIRAYQHGDLSLVYPLARGVAPMIVTFIGIAALGETLSAHKLMAVIAISTGVIAMTFRHGLRVLGSQKSTIAYAFGTAAFTASYTLVDGVGARLSGTATGFAMWMFIADGLCMCLYTLTMRGTEAFRGLFTAWKSGIAAGTMSLGSYWIAIWAFTLAPIALVAALRESSVLFALLIAGYFLKEAVGIWRWLGAALICFGIGFIRF